MQWHRVNILILVENGGIPWKDQPKPRLKPSRANVKFCSFVLNIWACFDMR